jgi:hypothetical protein
MKYIVKPLKTTDWEHHGFQEGDIVVCTESDYSEYTVGNMYKVVKSDFAYWGLTLEGTCNGFDGEFKLISRAAKKETPMQYPYSISKESITVYLDGKVLVVPVYDGRFEDLKKHLMGLDHDYDYLSSMLDKPKQIAKMTEGLVEVRDDMVYYKGDLVNDTLSQKLVDLLDEGFDARPWAKFMNNLMENPSFRSREQLYKFLELHGAPITPDGHFIAFKNVRGDFMDIHSGTFDNSPGKVVSMPRTGVDDDQNRTCSSGLHACASPYLGSFYVDGHKTVAVKINPRDVVSIPTDYNFAKMRVCMYEVLHEVDQEQIRDIEGKAVYPGPVPVVTPMDDYSEFVESIEDDYYDSYEDSYYDSYDEN